MQTRENEFPVEYVFQPSADAKERLAEAFDLILALILEELQNKPPDGQ
ncbi:MAG: hypothetical protein KIT07_06460 [Anaerolineales bacterium]|nr:hypothetical protein [Anaerolineales bacterium]